jgi:hypothetical protein
VSDHDLAPIRRDMHICTIMQATNTGLWLAIAVVVLTR